MPAAGFFNHSFQSFLKTPGHCCSEDGHLLARPGVPHRTRVQTGISAQRGAQSKQDTAHTRTRTHMHTHAHTHAGTETWGVQCLHEKHVQGATGRGPSGCLCGGGRGEWDMAFQEAVVAREGLAGERKHWGAAVPGTGRGGRGAQQAWRKTDPTK